MDTGPSRRRYVRAVGTVAVGLGLAGCSGDVGGAPTAHRVDMTDDLTFEPATLAVAVGDTVAWRNVGSVAHSVTAYGDGLPDGAPYFASGGFDSEDAAREAYPEGAVRSAEPYSHTFEVPGRHEYFCIPHKRAGMTGRIEVSGEQTGG